MGVSTTITPVVTANLDTRPTSTRNRTAPIQPDPLHRDGNPGATITFSEQQQRRAEHHDHGRLARGNYTITVPLGTESNTFTVTPSDAFGQVITGTDRPGVLQLAPRVASRADSTT